MFSEDIDDESRQELSLSLLTILEVSSPETYIILSFPVFSVQLRRMKWEYVECTGNVVVCDGYVRHCSALDGPLPVTVQVEKGYSNVFC